MLLAAVVALSPSVALGQGSGAPAGGQAEMPDLDADLTAYRVDCDVFGWNKSFTEVAAIGSEVRRTARGAHRGEAFMLVFDIGSTVPKHNVHVLKITQAALPHDPIPLEDIRGRMWGIDFVYQRKWPKRPKRKRPKGAMKIEPIWESVEIEPDICQPAVGFLLAFKGQRRYQQHQMVPDVRAPCNHLRLTDTRIYWAKKDLGVAMLRYDYSATDNEVSLRFPLSAAWNLARPVDFVLRAPANRPETQAAKKILSVYGEVTIEPAEPASSWIVAHAPEYLQLAHRIAAQLDGHVTETPPPAGITLLIARSEPQPQEKPLPATTRASELFDEEDPDCGGLLRDCR
jgi:hypothetical protein